MAHTICVGDLSPALAALYLSDEAAALDRVERALVLAQGGQRRTLLRYRRAHKANLQFLADHVYGPVSADLATMSNADLLAELGVQS